MSPRLSTIKNVSLCQGSHTTGGVQCMCCWNGGCCDWGHQCMHFCLWIHRGWKNPFNAWPRGWSSASETRWHFASSGSRALQANCSFRSWGQSCHWRRGILSLWSASSLTELQKCGNEEFKDVQITKHVKTFQISCSLQDMTRDSAAIS